MNSINKKLSKELVQGEFSRGEYRIGIFSQMGKSREFIGEETNAKVCDAICRATYELIRVVEEVTEEVTEEEIEDDKSWPICSTENASDSSACIACGLSF